MPLTALGHDHGHGHSSHASEAHGYDHKQIAALLAALEPPKEAQAPEGARVTVHAAVSRFSVLYERIRNAVEYREDHLLRKGAIERILKRQLVLETDPHVIANHLVRELIGARYLPNGVLPDQCITEAAIRVRKYQAIARMRAGNDRHVRWLLGVVAAELEDLLANPVREKALISFLYEQLADRVTVKNAPFEDTERRLQVYVACYRALVKADEASVGYKLLRAYVPEWTRPEEWIDHPRAMAERLVGVHGRIQDRLRHPLSQRFLRAVKPWAVSLSLLTEALLEEKHREELLESSEELHTALAHVTERREREARGKLRRGTLRAMVYLFITKIIFAVILEIPIEKWFYDEWSTHALTINLLLPPVLMFFVGLFIRPPGLENRRQILKGAEDLLKRNGIPAREIRAPARRRGMALFLMNILYMLTFLLTFGLVGVGLWRLDFTIVATTIFFFFLCVVSFFGYRLRQTAREIMVIQPKERLTSTLIDFLSLPILRAGQWLSQTVSRLNVFVFLFDFLIEAPFKICLNILEDWLSFIKEKKEELSEE
ncbi:MAG: hypothetical protein RL141_486 [Candidatus Parcubacteria bacterium]|jgi:hypothetical protein